MDVKTPKIVQPGERSYKVVILLVLFLVGALIAYGMRPFWETGQSERGLHAKTALAEQAEYIKRLETERDELIRKVAELERSSQIDRQAVDEVKVALQTELDNRLKTQQELTFLRELVSSSEKKRGLYLRGFSLEETGGEQAFQYRFTVAVKQRMKDAELTSGWVELWVEGRRGDAPVALTLAELTGEKDQKIKMRFKHFQKIQGVIYIPDAFIPERMVIEVTPSGSKLPPLKKTYDWLVTD